MNESLREKIAKHEHFQWSSWVSYQLKHLTTQNILRWSRQMRTPYADLSEAEKDKDREWVDKLLTEIGLEVDQDTYERLADLEHQQWSHWIRYVFDNLENEALLWKQQAQTPYEFLTDQNKNGDREWADKVLEIIQGVQYNPWKVTDVKRHNKKASNYKRASKLWVETANKELSKDGDEGRAIRIANHVVKNWLKSKNKN